MIVRAKYRGIDKSNSYRVGKTYYLEFHVFNTFKRYEPLVLNSFIEISNSRASFDKIDNSEKHYKSLKKFLEDWEVI